MEYVFNVELKTPRGHHFLEEQEDLALVDRTRLRHTEFWPHILRGFSISHQSRE